MKNVIILITISLIIGSTSFAQVFSNSNYNGDNVLELEIVPGIIVIKLKQVTELNLLSKSNSALGISSIDNKLQKMGVLNVSNMFQQPLSIEKSELSRIIKLDIPEKVNPLFYIRELKNDPYIEYVEPVYRRFLFEVPNDSNFYQQQYLNQIKAPEAWDIQKGDSNVVIATVDIGVDLEHEDLKANLWINKIEANGITGVDDDNNGFIDDIHGWDFGDNDADPSNVSSSEHFAFYHGTHCAGIACAVSDNSIGISGVSWNCKLMAIKTLRENVEQHINGYNGIIYAADNGADIISISWGGPGFLQWEQDVINYAYHKGSIVVCAAGNTGSEALYYPASYEKSVSVAAIETDNTKSDFSTFGYSIDISAPGRGILSTIPYNNYDFSLGTSMSCPIVAGVFGLVKSMHPEWNSNQIIKQVLLSAEDISSENPLYIDKLGHGVVNAYNSLSFTNILESDARLDLFSFEYDDSLYGNNNRICELGETIVLKTVIRNYSVGATETASFNLTSPNSDVIITQGNYSMVSFPADTTKIIEFTIMISEQCDEYEISLNLDMNTSLGFNNHEVIPLTIGTKPILLIDHDDNQADFFTQVEPFYRNILEDSKIPYTYWNFSQYGFPKSDFLQNYPIIIMFKEIYPAFASCSRFTLDEITALQKYLERGGNLFICGPNIGYELNYIETEIEAKEFMKDYLHAEFVEDMTDNLSVQGILDDPISDSITFNLYQPYLQYPYFYYDVIKPTEDAAPIFTYGDGKAGAITYSGNHKVIYSGFGLEAIDSDPSTVYEDNSPIRNKVLMRSLNWLNFIEHHAISDVSDTTDTEIILVNVRPISPQVKSIKLFWKERYDSEFDSLAMDKNLSQFSCPIPSLNKSTIIDYYIKTEFDYFSWTNPLNAPKNLYSYEEVTGIEDNNSSILNQFSLNQNYPNPFNPTTTIKYCIPSSSAMLNSFQHLNNSEIPKQVRDDNVNVALKVYDILGREVAKLVHQKQKPGNYEVTWDASNHPSGVYFYKLTAGDFVQVRKMILLK